MTREPALTLITGGGSSGKTTQACRLAAAHGERVLYVATCEPRDAGMHAKVARHRAERPASWTTREQSVRVADALDPGWDAAVVDCLTLLISQQLVAGVAEDEILKEVDALAAGSPGYPVYVVSNEVGLGVIPVNALARRFAELQGRANQRVAQAADRVVCMISGLPLTLKGDPCRS